jgi:hypothetical protein
MNKRYDETIIFQKISVKRGHKRPAKYSDEWKRGRQAMRKAKQQLQLLNMA